MLSEKEKRATSSLLLNLEFEATLSHGHSAANAAAETAYEGNAPSTISEDPIVVFRLHRKIICIEVDH